MQFFYKTAKTCFIHLYVNDFLSNIRMYVPTLQLVMKNKF